MKRILAVLAAAACAVPLSSAFAQTAPTVDVRNQSIAQGTISDYVADHADTAQMSAGNACYERADDMGTEFNCLYQALSEAGLVETLAGDGPFTVFAPNDRAFADLASTMGTSEFAALMRNGDALTPILTYHVLPRELTLENMYRGADGLSGNATETTVQGSTVDVNFYHRIENENPTVATVGATEATDALTRRSNVAYVIGATTRVDNGTIIPISYVLTPPAN